MVLATPLYEPVTLVTSGPDRRNTTLSKGPVPEVWRTISDTLIARPSTSPPSAMVKSKISTAEPASAAVDGSFTGSLTVADAISVPSWSMGRTVIATVSVARLKAVIPPSVLMFTAVSPLFPLVRSHALNVRPALTVPLKLRSGTKRSLLVAPVVSRAALEALTPASGFQLPPLSVEYSQAPFVSSTPITAIPSSGLSSTSVIGSPTPSMIAETRSPAGLVTP